MDNLLLIFCPLGHFYSANVRRKVGDDGGVNNLSVGPEGSLAQIMMGPTGVTVSGTMASMLMVQPLGISTMTPMMNLMAQGPITFVSPPFNENAFETTVAGTN